MHHTPQRILEEDDGRTFDWYLLLADGIRRHGSRIEVVESFFPHQDSMLSPFANNVGHPCALKCQ